MATQSDYRVTARLNGLEVAVVTLRLYEALSQPFELHLDVYEERPLLKAISFKKLLDAEAQITLWDGLIPKRHLHGLISQLRAGKIGKRRRHYHVTVVPDLHRLQLTGDCRIFQQQDVRAILATLLEDNGIRHYRFDLIERRQKREYCVQYNETDFDFFHRLAAEEGIFYWFEHNKNQHLLRISDAIERTDALKPPLQYAERSADKTAASVWQLDYHEQLVTAQSAQREYTFHNPGYNLEHRHSGLHLDNQRRNYESYRYHGRYKRDEQGKPFTRYYQEQAQRQQRQAELTHDYLEGQAGQYFELLGHPDSTYNQRWVSVENQLEIDQPQAAEEDAMPVLSISAAGPEVTGASRTELTTTCIPWGQAWRPPTPPKPIVQGPQMAHVVGPPGEEIYCDDWGRVKIQFPWDRYGKNNDLSSCWIRVAQNWAGGAWGHMAIPRVGHEVIVDFLEGDPDQPIVTGRTYHTANPPPYRLPQHKTRMTIKSRTHKGSGYNELRFEDEKAKEQIYLHGQKDYDIIIENDRKEWIRHDRHLRVDNDKYEQIHQDSHQTIGQDKSDRIERHRYFYAGGNFIWQVVGQVHRWIEGGLQLFVKASRATEIGSSDELVIGANQRTAVGNESYTKAKSIVLEANQELTVKGPGGFIKIDSSGIIIKGNIVKINSGGSPGSGTAPKAPTPEQPPVPTLPKDAEHRGER